MSDKGKKQFGVWMDSHNATIAGRENIDRGAFVILEHVKNQGAAGNSNENSANNHEVSQTQKFFKEILSKVPNIDEVHITGTGQVQEQFIKYLAETAQYKHAVATESTANKMSDEQLLSFFSKHFN
ncbi:MAG: hypothetical protein V4725_08085 [Bacteroidota bacterium]|nr:hypothetical protein [Ferruginibacter sp.]